MKEIAWAKQPGRCPDEYKDQPSRTKEHELVAKDLEEKGMTNLQSWLFFTCEDCVPVVEERRKLREEQERQRQERLREIAAARERQEASASYLSTSGTAEATI